MTGRGQILQTGLAAAGYFQFELAERGLVVIRLDALGRQMWKRLRGGADSIEKGPRLRVRLQGKHLAKLPDGAGSIAFAIQLNRQIEAVVRIVGISLCALLKVAACVPISTPCGDHA